MTDGDREEEGNGVKEKETQGGMGWCNGGCGHSSSSSSSSE